jgi:hypothetical protein
LKSITPPTFGPYIFYNLTNIPKIYVPAEAVDAYKSDQYWGEYADKIVPFLEIDPTLPSGSFTIEVEATAGKANIVVTPSDAVKYHYSNVVSAAKYAEYGGTDESFLAAYIAELTATFENYGYTWLDMVSEGVDAWIKRGLTPETDYYVVAFGIDANGVATTKLAKQAFTTSAAKDYSSWFGTWTASTPKSYSFMNDSALGDVVEGVVDTPKSQTIFIQDAVEYTGNPENAGLALVWNTSAFFEADASKGLDKANMKFALGEFNADGELELANNYTVYEGEGYTATWLAYCSAKGISASTTFVHGEYAAHTFPLAQNGVSTSVPFKGGIQGGGSFKVFAFDIFAIAGGGQISFFNLEDDVPVNLFYGPIKVEKTSNDIPIAPQTASLKKAVNSAIKSYKTSKTSKVAGVQAKVRL